MEAPVEVQPKKPNTMLIVGIVVAVLLCCCCLVVIGAFTLLGPAVSQTFSTINSDFELTAVPDLPIDPELPGNPEPSDPSQSDDPFEMPEIPALPSDAVPQGGLGDDLLRVNTWSYVLIGAAASGCTSPNPATTVIEVTQEPDSNGVWEERWTVDCGDGTEKPFDITFTPNPNGGTDINVKLQP